MTGRYPWGIGYYDMKGPEAIPLDFKLVANLLADAGYETHAIVRRASLASRALPSLAVYPAWATLNHGIQVSSPIRIGELAMMLAGKMEPW